MIEIKKSLLRKGKLLIFCHLTYVMVKFTYIKLGNIVGYG